MRTTRARTPQEIPETRTYARLRRSTRESDTASSDPSTPECYPPTVRTSGGHYRRIGRHRPRDGRTAGARRRGAGHLRTPPGTARGRRRRNPRRRRRGAGGDADVTREADMDALVASAVDRFGRLDVMMCNAGFGIYGSIDQIDAGADAAAARRELHGHLPRGTRRAARLPPAGAATLIIVSSIVGKRGMPYMGGVCGHEVRAGRPRRVPARRAARLGHPRDRRLSRYRPTPNSST